MLDLFIFLGEPKEVVSEYTAITGRSPVPPLWSFGLWMSRITYKSEAEVRDVAAKLRQYKVPADVLHLDTGWFETDWRSDYQFSKTRFTDPAKMIADLKKEGFHISLWQYTYFTPKNALWKELVDQGLAVKDARRTPRHRGRGARLHQPEGGGVVQGEARRAAARWASAPSRPTSARARRSTGSTPPGARAGTSTTSIRCATTRPSGMSPSRSPATASSGRRSAWAGSQRYPLHWGGDAENTNSAMAAELRGGLSFGLSGFTFWSHDVGGFVQRAPRDLYRRWLAFGVLTSHTRTHGAPPREPWEYDAAMRRRTSARRSSCKYSLMPYIYAQAQRSSAKGWPMLRTLFFEYPDDPTSWSIEDEYMFGATCSSRRCSTDSATSRRVYLPPGTWIDYQTGRAYAGARWHEITAGAVPIVLLVKDHTVLPHVAVAQSTAQIDWKNVELRTFSTDGAPPKGRSSSRAAPYRRCA